MEEFALQAAVLLISFLLWLAIGALAMDRMAFGKGAGIILVPLVLVMALVAVL